MADYIVKDTELTSVANAIRTAGGTSSLLNFPNGFVSAVNNISGGGGSSDFSTAQAVVINNLQYDAVPLGVAHLTTVPTEATMPIFTAQPAGTSNITVALYKNTALCLILAESAPVQNVSVSGNAEFVPDAGGVIITGDCTITIL